MRGDRRRQAATTCVTLRRVSNRRHRVTIPLPGEEIGRRSFLVKGILGGVLLVAGGGLWLGTRRTQGLAPAGAALQVFSAEEIAVLLAVANRLVPERHGFPRPAALRVPAKIDAIAAMSDPATQADLRRLVRLFESALAAFVLDGQPRLFTASSAASQDRRLAAWAQSRLAIRRTGFRALKRLVYAAYYGSPETWPAVGYPGPPISAPPRASASPTEVRDAPR
jgi:hypothetical protein